MKAGKALGPSGIVVEMIWVAGDIGASMIHDLAAAIICDGKVPSNWSSFIVCLYKVKGDVLERGNYPGLKLTEQVMRVLEKIVDGLIRQLVSIDDSQFGFVPGRCTTDTIFVVRQLQEKYLAAIKRLHGFRRPEEGIWSSASGSHLVGTEKTWCGGVDCATGAGAVCQCADPCPCWWGVQWRVWSEGWCSPRLGTRYSARCSSSLCLKHCQASSTLGSPGRTFMPMTLLSLNRSKNVSGGSWGAMEEKGLRVNAWKTRIMICGKGLDLLQSSGEFLCAVCHTGVGSNSIFCNGGKYWVHKKCRGRKHLTKDPDYRMYTVPGNCMPLGRLGCQTTEGSPSQTRQARGGSFLLLPRRHALSSPWLWTFNRLEEVQGATTCSHFPPLFFQDTWLCVQFFCVKRNAPCQWDLAIDKAKPSTSAVEWQGNDQTDLQCQAARHCHLQVQWATCAAWHWGSAPHSDGEKAPLVWTCGKLHWCSQDSLWHTGWWKAWAWESKDDMETVYREELQRVEALGCRL